MSALSLTGQIQIEIEYDITESTVLSAVSALCAKTLFSSSMTSRNITARNCYASDAAISRFLQMVGYRCANAAHPLELTLSRGERPSSFAELATRTNTGDGWCNMNCPDFLTIDNPLYDGTARVPMIGNVNNIIPVDFNTMGAINFPPTWTTLLGVHMN